MSTALCVPKAAGGWLATKEDYTNFQLQVDFRTSAPDINSGVFLRRARQDGDSHQIGYELQIRNPSPGDKPFDGKRATTTPTTPAAFPVI